MPSLSCPARGQAYPVEKLLEFDAIKLFVERTQASLTGFELNPQNSAAVTQICLRLDGIPLAIELAASRGASLGIAQIAERLDQSFRMLTGGARTMMERHRTLRSTIEWSYQLISDHERILLRRLGIFMNGWTLEAAEKVCSGEDLHENMVLDLLSQLVNKSLVLVDHLGEREPRYHMLATIREFALEELFRNGESEELHKRHFEWAAGLAAQAGPHLYTGKRLEWMKRLRAEHNNLHAALEWAIEEGNDLYGGIEILYRIGPQYWHLYALNDGLHFMERANELVMADPASSQILQVKTLYLLVLF